MKTLTSLLLVAALGFVLVGCGSGPEPEPAPDTSKASAKFEAGSSQGAANAPTNKAGSESAPAVGDK